MEGTMRIQVSHQNFLLGLVAGALLSFASLSISSRAGEVHHGNAGLTNSGFAGNCKIRLGQRRLTNAPRCYEGEVVSGIMTTSYYCSKLILECDEENP
jgi:hypothetical protein